MTEVKTSHYLVAFIDLLGQRAQMEGLLFIPPKGEVELRAEFNAKITRLMGAIDFIQQHILSFIDETNKRHLSKIEGIDIDAQARIQKFRKANVRFQNFSDGVVLYASLGGKDHYPLSSIYSTLAACASAMLCTLDRGCPVRIGIAIGAGCLLNGNGIYGPVVAEAYRLESEVAFHPRISVHEGVLSWLSLFETRQYASEQERTTALLLAGDCRKLLFQDTDDTLALDFLGEMSLKMMGGAANTVTLIAGMKKFVSEMIGKFQSTGDEKLLRRYEAVNHYINSRLPR